MYVRPLGYVLLVWFPAVLHAQVSQQTCTAQVLRGVFLVPQQNEYEHGTSVGYSCDEGLKPAVEGWWGRSTCQNGKWSPVPKCIDEKGCIPPNIPNGKNTVSDPDEWIKKKIQVKCDEGYELRGRNSTARCINGTWISLPICKVSASSCRDPPKLPHAVIIHRRHREVFPVDSHVEYECEAGYTTEEGHTRKSVYCISGNWTNLPTCTSSTGSGSSGRELQPVPIRNCGKIPSTENGDIVQTHPMFLRYQCSIFYSLVGSERVLCYSNGKWSETPTCKAAFCALNTEEYPALKNTGLKFIKNDETISLECEKKRLWLSTHFAEVQCTDGEAQIGRCCGWIERKTACW